MAQQFDVRERLAQEERIPLKKAVWLKYASGAYVFHDAMRNRHAVYQRVQRYFQYGAFVRGQTFWLEAYREGRRIITSREAVLRFVGLTNGENT